MKPGEVVAGRFTIERPAGYGAMGAVYRAMDRLTGAPVALKVLHKEGSKRNVRFEREATLLAALRHPAVVRYVLHGATPAGAPFLAMEWVDGETLSDRLTDAPLSVEDSILVMSTIASALAEAHAHGVVHRDLKPGNVLLADGDVRRVKVIDFGIARRPESELTATGVAIGSPGYMAPEQARGDKDIDPRADVFSLGCVLYRCIAGAPPFAADDVRAVIAKILVTEPPPLAEVAPHTPAPLAALVTRMLSKEPAARPADGGAVADALAALGPRGDGRGGVKALGRGLTASERRLVCVVAAASPADIGSLDEPTTLSSSGTALV
ncbi:MAG TPA: serine/threonine-protein kinase, partial [Byssovorax sp.]